MLTSEDLRAIDLFEALDEPKLAVWLQAAEPFEAAPGDVIAEQGEPSPGLLLVLEGTVEELHVAGERAEPVGRHDGPAWLGAVAALTEGTLDVRLRARSACRLARIPPASFVELTVDSRHVHTRVLREIAARETAAGLARQLAAPAAAATRASGELLEALAAMNVAGGALVAAGIARAEGERLARLLRVALATATGRDAPEEAMLARLERLGVPEPRRLAVPLAAAGVGDVWLARVAELAGDAVEPALDWLAAALRARALAGELQGSAQRIDALVRTSVGA